MRNGSVCEQFSLNYENSLYLVTHKVCNTLYYIHSAIANVCEIRHAENKPCIVY